jgi:hypothetical protein
MGDMVVRLAVGDKLVLAWRTEGMRYVGEVNMRAVICGVGLMCLVLAGCAGTGTSAKSAPTAVPPEVVLLDESLKKALQLGTVNTARSSNKLLSVQVGLANLGSSDLALQAQTWYQDAQGNYLQPPEVREGAWTTFYLPANMTTLYRSQALGPGAEKYTIRIRINPVGSTAPTAPPVPTTRDGVPIPPALLAPTGPG